MSACVCRWSFVSSVWGPRSRSSGPRKTSEETPTPSRVGWNLPRSHFVLESPLSPTGPYWERSGGWTDPLQGAGPKTPGNRHGTSLTVGRVPDPWDLGTSVPVTGGPYRPEVQLPHLDRHVGVRSDYEEAVETSKFLTPDSSQGSGFLCPRGPGTPLDWDFLVSEQTGRTRSFVGRDLGGRSPVSYSFTSERTSIP